MKILLKTNNSQKELKYVKKTKGSHKLIKKFSENINLSKIQLSQKTKELNKLMKRFSENIQSKRFNYTKKQKELQKLIKILPKHIDSNVLVIIDGWTWVIDGNYTFVRGSVKNTGNVAISYFEVNVKYEDVNKNVLDSDFANWDRKIQPGESKEFQIKHHINKNYQCIDISVNNYK